MAGRRLTVLQMLPALNGGGVERGTLEVAQALVKQGHRSIVISSGGNLVSELERTGSEHLAWGVTKRDHVFALRYLWRLRDFLRREQVDIVHVRSRHPAWVAWLAWRGMSADNRPRFLTTAHGLYRVNRYSSVMARGERVIAISQTVQNYLLQSYPQYVRPETVELIYRGIDPCIYRCGMTPNPYWLAHWNDVFPNTVGRRLLTLPGRLTRLKGHHDFLEIVDRVRRVIPDVCGLIVGGADAKQTGYEQELQREVARRGLGDAIEFTGHREDMREILALSDISYSLTSNPPEAFGRTVVEALSLGTPVVGYNHAGVGEILQALQPEGAITPGDIEAAVRVTLDILQARCPWTIQPNTHFLQKQMIDQTLGLYGRMTSGDS